VKHLPAALKFLQTNPNNLRPESEIYGIMIQNGHSYYLDNKCFGLHDFYQSNNDIIRKAFFHTKKHSGLLSKMPALWSRLSREDIDYKIGLIGLFAGLMDNDEISVDIDFFNRVSKKYMSTFSISEKPSLETDLLKTDDLIVAEIEKFEELNKQRKKLRVRKFPAIYNGPMKYMLCGLAFAGNYIEQVGKKVKILGREFKAYEY
jgi:hypothetical protein